MNEPIAIKSADFWVKIVGMLQHNWAVIDDGPEGSVRMYFVGDTSGVFDEMTFPSRTAAEQGLRRNGFKRFTGDADLASFLVAPSPPFYRRRHPNGPVYSSGRFWRGGHSDQGLDPSRPLK